MTPREFRKAADEGRKVVLRRIRGDTVGLARYTRENGNRYYRHFVDAYNPMKGKTFAYEVDVNNCAIWKGE